MNENIFSCMELMRQQYTTVMMIPIGRFYEMLKWKSKLEEEKQRIIKDRSGKISSGPTSRK